MATLQVKALFDCEADRPGELSFNEGDILVDVTESKEKGWYEGRPEGSLQRGLFPINYVEPLKQGLATTVRVPRHDAEKKDTVQPENFDHISDRFRVDIRKRHILPPRSFSEESVTTKESNDLAPTVSPLRANPRRTEAPNPGSKSTSNVLEILQQKSVGIRQEISSRAQNYSIPSLSNIKYRKTNNEKISKPFQTKKEREIKQTDTHRNANIAHSISTVINDTQLIKPSQLNNNNKTNIIKKISAPSSPALSPRPNRSFRIRSSTMSDMKISPFYSNNANNNSEEIMVSGLRNPMPPLPSRPKSIASKKSRISRNFGSNNEISPELSQAIDTITPHEEEKDKGADFSIKRTDSPAIKPKPNTLRPTFPSRSVSNQSSSSSPQLECETTLLSNNSDDSLITKKKLPPTIPAKPSISLSSRVHSPSTKPCPPPKPAKSSRTTGKNCQSSANEKEEQDNSAPLKLGNKLSTKNDDLFIMGKPGKNYVTSLTVTEIKKKAPPPPPPSMSPRTQERKQSMKTGAAARARYEILFETIQDNGYVDEEVTQTLWRKNKLSKDEIERIWRECDSDNKKILDRDGFIKSMTMIDSFLTRQEQVI